MTSHRLKSIGALNEVGELLLELRLKDCPYFGHYCPTRRRRRRLVRSSLIDVYGNIGNVHTFLTDFEMAAMKAIGQVFPETRVKGCSFTFDRR